MDCMHNTDAEMALLGEAMNDGLVAAQVATLPETLFTDEKTKAVHRAIKRLTAKGKTPDLVTLDAEVQCDFSDTALLVDMQGRGWSVSLAGQHEALLAEAAKRRALVDMAQKVLSDAPNPGASVTALEAEAEKLLRKADAGEESEDMSAAVAALFDDLQTGGKDRLQTGVADFDTLTGGFAPGQLIYLAARPGVGKTAIGLSMAAHVARKSGAVLLVSLEMGLSEIAARLAAAETGVDLQKISTCKVGESDWEKIGAVAGNLANLPMRITCRAQTPLQVRREAVRMQARVGLKMIVIDYIQLMRGDGRYGSRYEEISAVSREMKSMAMELKVPILCMCQLNRQSEKGFGKAKKTEPSMAEARDSGALEQDANIFLTLYEPEEPEEQNDDWQKYHACVANGMAWQRLKVEKNRQGRTGVLDVAFDKAHMKYTCLRMR